MKKQTLSLRDFCVCFSLIYNIFFKLRLFAAVGAVFGRRNAVILLKLFVKAAQTLKTADVANLHHALVGRPQQLGGVVRAEPVHEL